MPSVTQGTCKGTPDSSPGLPALLSVCRSQAFSLLSAAPSESKNKLRCAASSSRVAPALVYLGPEHSKGTQSSPGQGGGWPDRAGPRALVLLGPAQDAWCSLGASPPAFPAAWPPTAIRASKCTRPGANQPRRSPIGEPGFENSKQACELPCAFNFPVNGKSREKRHPKSGSNKSLKESSPNNSQWHFLA